MRTQFIRPIVILARICLASFLACFLVASAWALDANVRDVLNRLDKVNRTGGHGAGILTEAERALLVANNDAINAARLNREISNSVYQAAQADFALLNQEFASSAARSAGADFTVQTRTSPVFSPGD